MNYVLKYTALPTYLLTCLIMRFFFKGTHPWKVPGQNRLRFDLYDWAKGRTFECEVLDYVFWISLACMLLAVIRFFHLPNGG